VAAEPEPLLEPQAANPRAARMARTAAATRRAFTTALFSSFSVMARIVDAGRAAGVTGR
jgi:hypothetical protein